MKLTDRDDPSPTPTRAPTFFVAFDAGGIPAFIDPLAVRAVIPAYPMQQLPNGQVAQVPNSPPMLGHCTIISEGAPSISIAEGTSSAAARIDEGRRAAIVAEAKMRGAAFAKGARNDHEAMIDASKNN